MGGTQHLDSWPTNHARARMTATVPVPPFEEGGTDGASGLRAQLPRAVRLPVLSPRALVPVTRLFVQRDYRPRGTHSFRRGAPRGCRGSLSLKNNLPPGLLGTWGPFCFIT